MFIAQNNKKPFAPLGAACKHRAPLERKINTWLSYKHQAPNGAIFVRAPTGAIFICAPSRHSKAFHILRNSPHLVLSTFSLTGLAAFVNVAGLAGL
jgi:hypothetical protein